MSEWVAVSERFPSEGLEVLMCVFEYGRSPPYCVCGRFRRWPRLDRGYWQVTGVSGWECENDFKDDDVRYWRELPEMPSA